MGLSNAQRQARWRKNHPAEAKQERKTRVRSSRKTKARDMRFIAFDGEGSDGKYQLLAASVGKPIVAEQGLSTMECLSFFAKLLVSGEATRSDAFIGFGLGYDFEMMLRDVPDADYIKLIKGQKAKYGPFKIGYVQRKFLDVSFRAAGEFWSFRLNDIYPYFQTSFIKACATYGIPLPEIVYEGKRNRGGFSFDDMDKIIVYNQAELDAMVRLASNLRDDFLKAFDRVGTSASLGKRDWYGPGAQAGAIMRTLNYDELKLDTVQKDRITQAVLRSYDEDLGYNSLREKVRDYGRYLIMTDPFAASYFGGRIEATMQGRLDGPLYDYDLISAYPYAMTMLPAIRGKKLREIHTLDSKDRVGIYLVHWRLEDIEHAPPFGPLPYRTAGGNVYFPVTGGYGWYLSPEVYGLIDSGLVGYIKKGYVFDGTEGYGRGTRKGDSTLAQFVELMGRVRAQAKAEGDPAHRGLKLLMNSLYGKTLQKVGARTYFNAFVASWITSVTRARIHSILYKSEPGQVVSIMTDGVLSRVPLPAVLGSELGQWEVSMFDSGYQFAPGIYVLNRGQYRKGDEAERLVKYRGFAKFDADAAIAAFESGGIYDVVDQRFISRSLALHQPKIQDKAYRFVGVRRKEDFSLGSKREVRYQPLHVTDSLRYFPPKLGDLMGTPSFPYDVIDKNESILKQLLEETRRVVS